MTNLSDSLDDIVDRVGTRVTISGWQDRYQAVRAVGVLVSVSIEADARGTRVAAVVNACVDGDNGVDAHVAVFGWDDPDRDYAVTIDRNPAPAVGRVVFGTEAAVAATVIDGITPNDRADR